MENASKALLMATGILLGVLLLSLLVFVFYFMGSYSSSVQENIDAGVIYDFNIKFQEYDGRKDLTAQDVVTIYNLVQNYNSKFEQVSDIHKIQITGNVKINDILQTNLDNMSNIDNMAKYTMKITSYYNDRVNTISIMNTI